MKLSIIVVNFRSKKYLKKCLQGIDLFLSKKKASRLNFEVIVVNNDQETIDFVISYPFVSGLINNPHNLGFGKANNEAEKRSRGKYLLFLNPDTELIDDSLEKTISYLDKNKSVGILGPKIIDSYRNAPQPWTSGSKTSLFNILFRNTINKPWNKDSLQQVDWVSGTALLIRKSLFNKVGGFDENFFMYFEDQDLCLRIKKLRKKVIFYPQCQVIHHNGKSWTDKRNQKGEYFQSQDYFFQKHGKKWERKALSLLRKLSMR